MHRLGLRSVVTAGGAVAVLALSVGPGGVRVPAVPAPAHADESDDFKNPYEGDPAAIERGLDLFNQRCSFCHGTRGHGAKGPCLTCGRFLYRGGTNAQLFATITAGIPNGQMGAFAASMTADDIWKVIAFLRAETMRRQAAGDPAVAPPRTTTQ